MIAAKDEPKPAVFLARKLLCDYIQISGLKIEAILAQENRDKPIFKTLSKDEDQIYDKILEAIGSISEFCLPSLLATLINWYHHQLADESESNHQTSIEYEPSQSLLRSPTPSSPETTVNHMSITSTLPLEYQSPSLTIISEHQSSAANTSNSTATNVSSSSLTEESSRNIAKSLELARTRKLLIEYVFCRALIEVFSQLHLHPGHGQLIKEVEDIAFEHFKYNEQSSSSNDTASQASILADKYAEVLGVLAQNRFKLVKKRFMTELNLLRSKEPTPSNIQCIVSLLPSMRYFRVKMAPIEDFEASFQFLHECAEYFLEVRHKSIKHTLANLFVEILVPLSVIIKNEVKIPCLKNFVDMLWPQTLEMSSRKKHSVVLYPLVTCLLCASQRSFFLSCWSSFLNMCLSNLKNRDQKMCRVALESLYRLIWIYMIRIKCESNNVTQSRLQSIVDAIFPRGNRSVTPRDSPLIIFVDMVHYIAQERLDFAMRHIIFDLLNVDRPQKVIVSPERMNIALQAFLVIADGLQQKEGEIPMPRVLGQPRARRNFCNNRTLSSDIAKQIGLAQYLGHVQRSFNEIIRALDSQLGRPMLLTIIGVNNNNNSKEIEITGDRKAKMELFKTCIAAIPRLMPDGISRSELIDLLSRMTVHVDEEMRKLAFEALQIMIVEFADWRLDCIEGFTLFLANQIDESMRTLVDKALSMLLQLLISWHSAITCQTNSATTTAMTATANQSQLQHRTTSVSIQTGYETISSRTSTTGGQIAARKNRALAEMRLIQSELGSTKFERLISVIQRVEGASLVMSCSCHQPTRRLAGQLMRECRAIVKCYTSWICMEQFGLKSADEVEEEDLSASLRGSLSADNLSRITTTSANGPAYSSVTSMNTQTMLSTSISRMCIAPNGHDQLSAGPTSTTANGTQVAANTARSVAKNSQQHQHDHYDSDLENNLADCLSSSDRNSALIFWVAVIMLDSEQEVQYLTALRLLRRVLPNLPLEQPEFMEEIHGNLEQMKWPNFPGIHKLILKGCTSSSSYDISIGLLDSLTPLLGHSICNGVPFRNNKSTCEVTANSYFPMHVVALMTQLLANYDDPTPACLNIARRIAIWCDESSLKGLENLATVMNLYSRRSFSKDGFQWTKCVIKYLNDVYKETLPGVIPLLVDLLEGGPTRVQPLIAPILYCIFTYMDATAQPANLIADISRLYYKYLSDSELDQWRDAVQLFKLLISRSSQLETSSGSFGGGGGGSNIGSSSTQQNGSRGRELPGRTLDFSLEVDSMPVIAKLHRQITAASAEIESNLSPTMTAGNELCSECISPSVDFAIQPDRSLHLAASPVGQVVLEDGADEQEASLSSRAITTPMDSKQEQAQIDEEESRESTTNNNNNSITTSAAVAKWRRSWLANGQIRERLVSLLSS